MSTIKKNKYSSNPPQLYSEAFKRQVVSEYESGLYSKATLTHKELELEVYR